MNKHIHRILFKLGFCKKEAKAIFTEASHRKNYYMCDRIGNILYYESNLDLKYTYTKLAKYMKVYGFTFENFKMFIQNNYPSLVTYLRNKEDYDDTWLSSIYEIPPEDVPLVRESKDKFLKHLADKL